MVDKPEKRKVDFKFKSDFIDTRSFLSESDMLRQQINDRFEYFKKVLEIHNERITQLEKDKTLLWQTLIGQQEEFSLRSLLETFRVKPSVWGHQLFIEKYDELSYKEIENLLKEALVFYQINGSSVKTAIEYGYKKIKGIEETLDEMAE